MLLLLIIIAAVIIPQLEFNSTPVLSLRTDYQFEFKDFEHYFDVPNQTQHQIKEHFDLMLFLKFIYVSGVIFFLFKALLQIFNIIKIFNNNRVIKQQGFKIVTTTDNLPPFSFFYWIFLPEETIKNKTNLILEHERIHAKQWHTFDLLLAELFSIGLWFMPFVYSFKNSIKSVHEYIADKQLTQQKTAKINYLNLLANCAEKYTLIGLSNNFYCCTLKNRITMITKHKTSKFAGLKYLLLIPAVTLLIQLFAYAESNNSVQNVIQDVVSVVNEETGITENIVVSNNLPKFISPIKNGYEITWGFEKRIDPISKKERFHKAMDLKATKGTEIVAVADGEVIKRENKPETYGQVIVIQHADGLTSLYAHMSTMKVNIGDKVKQGDVIGGVGNTGRSTGPHLHLEFLKDGERVNPNDYIEF